jgi:hypothetical protein
MKQLVTTYRHWRMTVVIVAQYLNVTSMTIKENVLQAYIFPQTSEGAMKAAYNNFLQGRCENARQARAFLGKMTSEKFSCLCFDKLKQGDAKYSSLIAPDMTKDRREMKFYFEK